MVVSKVVVLACAAVVASAEGSSLGLSGDCCNASSLKIGVRYNGVPELNQTHTDTALECCALCAADARCKGENVTQPASVQHTRACGNGKSDTFVSLGVVENASVHEQAWSQIALFVTSERVAR